MVYGDWLINEIEPSFQITADYSDLRNGKITLNCLAEKDDLNDPRVEIEQFLNLRCAAVSNTKLLNGGSKIYAVGGEFIKITDGFYTWDGVIEDVRFKEDHSSHRHILFDIVLQVELVGKMPPTVYLPPYTQYANIDYNEFTETSEISHQELGTKIVSNKYSMQRLPQGVWQQGGNCPVTTNWGNLEGVKNADGNLAYAYLNRSNVGCTTQLIVNNFGFNIPPEGVVTRLAVKVRYANNSRRRAPYFNKAWHNVNAGGAYQNQDFVQGSTPGGMAEAWFELGLPSQSPAFYNNPGFSVVYAATLDKYKTCWVDYILVYIEYTISHEEEEIIIVENPIIQEQKPELGSAIGVMRISEQDDVSKVVVSGSACNGPAWLELNGIRKEWHFSHDTNTDNTLPLGNETLTFELLAPAKELMFKTSKHLERGNKYSDNLGCILDWVEVIYK